jgi:hypothetical protein
MKKVAIVFVLIIIGIQFFSVNKTNPPVNDGLDAPPEIKGIFKRACYDCHSNETNWPITARCSVTIFANGGLLSS